MLKKPLYGVPDNKKVRIIIDTDAYAEGDDQYAIVHALLTPKFDVRGIVAEQFGHRFEDTMERSYGEINRVLEHMGLAGRVPLFKGAEKSLSETGIPEESEGAKFIIEEALRDDERPLFVLNMGAITNLASAYELNPAIADRLVAIWIGGGAYPLGGMDFNAGNDVAAANVVIGSPMELWQIPLSAYTMMEVSFHELFEKVHPCGEIGKYLVENLLRVNEFECAMDFSQWPPFRNYSRGAMSMVIRSGEGWSLGDSPAVGVLITSQTRDMSMEEARYINPDGTYGERVNGGRPVRVYNRIDSRVILADFYAKLKYHYGEPL